jgi:hypothetical protein
MSEDKVKKFDEILARAHRNRNPYTEEYGLGMELIIENGRGKLEEARRKYGKDWKKVPLKEVFRD